MSSAQSAVEANGNAISVLSWNILADRYAFKFSYCPREYLNWKSYRRHLILSKLADSHCDIIFLQEVDREQDIEFYLRGQNYFTVYHQRPSRKNDGCLISFKHTKFELDSSIYIAQYNELVPVDSSDETDHRRFRKDNIGMIVVLKSIFNPKLRIVAATTHLYWNPNFEDVKLFQTASFLNSIQWVIDKHQLTNYKVIIGGDFNSEPHSDVYQLIVNAFVKIPKLQVGLTHTENENDINDHGQEPEEQTNDLKISESQNEANSEQQQNGKQVLRIICDRDLRKAAQWLSLMEIDTAYFGEISTIHYEKLFEIAKNEKRIIVTRNTQITSRSDCPKFLLIGPRLSQREAYQYVVNYFGITIDFKKKESRQNISDCLRCPKCLNIIEPRPLDEIRDSLPSDNANLVNGLSSKGEKLEFYQCSNEQCRHLVYHRSGWLDRLHRRRQKHYNSTKDLHKQFQNEVNENKVSPNTNSNKKEQRNTEKKGNEEVLMWGMKPMDNSTFKAFGRRMNASLDELAIGQIHKCHFSKNDDTMYEISKVSETECEARNTQTNEIVLVSLQNVALEQSQKGNRVESDGSRARILKDHVYRKRRPVIIGIEVLSGTFKKYDRILAVKCEEKIDLGIISGIQDDGNEIKTAKSGQRVCVKLETEHAFGRQFDDTYCLLVQSRKNEKCKVSLPTQVIPTDDTFHTYPSLKSSALSHGLKLKSAHWSVFGHEPVTSNHTNEYSGCLDYVFVSMDVEIKQCDALPVPIERKQTECDKNENDIDEEKTRDHDKFLYNYLPDQHNPSDHLPIKAIVLL